MISRILVVWIGLLTLLSVPNGAFPQSDRQNLETLSPDVREFVQTWLGQDCRTGQIQELESRLLALGNRLEPVFWEAYRLGPPPEDLRRIREVMVRRYGERQEWLRTSGSGLLGTESRLRLLSVPQSQFVERETEGYVSRYKTSAIMGLAIVGTRASAAELERITANEKSPSHVAAGEALQRIRIRGR
jgi:hypothetical protein